MMIHYLTHTLTHNSTSLMLSDFKVECIDQFHGLCFIPDEACFSTMDNDGVAVLQHVFHHHRGNVDICHFISDSLVHLSATTGDYTLHVYR